jgi:environmental stress-induced protein Ves
MAHGVPFRFSGDASVRATLTQGAVQVLNVITRPAAVSASVVVDRLVPDRPRPVWPGQYVLLLAGWAILTVDGAEHGIGVHDTVRFGESGETTFVGEGLVAVVSFQPRSAA